MPFATADGCAKADSNVSRADFDTLGRERNRSRRERIQTLRAAWAKDLRGASSDYPIISRDEP